MSKNDNAHSIRLVDSLEKILVQILLKNLKKNIHYKKVRISKRNMNGQKMSAFILNRTLTQKQLLK